MIFGRPITGIHNRTYGPIVDMMFNVMMPVMGMSFSSEMALNAEMREALISPSCRRVIVLAHGAGATTVSYVMDKLHADLPMDCMTKMEIYTFGSAAKHMSNPCVMSDTSMRVHGSMGNMNSSCQSTMRREETERVIPVNTMPLCFQ